MRFIWPLTTHTVSRDFYYRASIYIGGQHMAIDIPASSGTPIMAVAAGKVAQAGYSNINGNYVEVRHADGWYTKYRHLVETTTVAVGAGVSQGQVIGGVGSTGWSTGPHLHFDLWNSSKQSPEAVYKQGRWAHDPELYLGQEDDDMDDARVKELIAEALTEVFKGRDPGDLARYITSDPDLRHAIEQVAKGAAGLKRGDTVILG